MRHGAGQVGGEGGLHPRPSTTDLRLVLVPDGSPNSVMEGGSIHLCVSPEQRLCACVGVVSRQGAPGAPPVPQPHVRRSLRLQRQGWARRQPRPGLGQEE